MQHKFFIQAHLHRSALRHGGIGNVEAERILLREGFKPLNFPGQFNFSLATKIKRVIYMGRMLASLPKGSVLVFQAPLYARIHEIFLKSLHRFREDIKLMCFITDINGFKDGNEELINKEMEFFRTLNDFIVHNPRMESWLKEVHSSARISSIRFFDMQLPEPASIPSYSKSVCFAGALDKSSFLNKLGEVKGVQFHIYGEGKAPQSSEVMYHGPLLPEELLLRAEGAFGLVWDGSGADDLRGAYGEYQKLISPSKASFYILSGRPLIVHPQSALAEIVDREELGVKCSNLFLLEPILEAVGEEAYKRMQLNLQKWAEPIREGRCLPRALRDLGVF